MRRTFIMILILLILFVCVTTAISENSTKPGIPVNPQLTYVNEITRKSTQDVTQLQTPIASFDSNGIGNSIMSVSYSSSPEDRVKIRKFTSPVNRSGYLLNDGLLISVEISCKDDNVDKVEVSEIIDDELYVVEEKSIYCKKLANISEIREYKKELLEDPFGSYADNCLLHCDVNISNSEWDENTNVKNNSLVKLFINKYNYTSNVSDNPSIRHLLDNLSTKFDVYSVKDLDQFRVNYSVGSYNIDIFNESNSRSINLSLNATDNTGLIYFSDDGRKYNLHVVENNSCLELYDVIKNFDFNVTHLNTDEVFVYKYEIKPKKRGIYFIDTIAKTYARPYIEYPMIIDANAKPKFEIYPLLSKNEVLEGTPVDLVYIIKYLGGGSQSSISNIKIKLDTNPQYRLDPEKQEPFNFSLYENKRITTKLTFNEPGSYTIPGIWLNEEYQTFGNINVNVKGTFENPLDLLLKYWILILAVIGLAKIKMLRDVFMWIIKYILIQILYICKFISAIKILAIKIIEALRDRILSICGFILAIKEIKTLRDKILSNCGFILAITEIKTLRDRIETLRDRILSFFRRKCAHKLRPIYYRYLWKIKNYVNII